MLFWDDMYISWLTFEQILKTILEIMDKQTVGGIVFYKDTFLVYIINNLKHTVFSSAYDLKPSIFVFSGNYNLQKSW